MENKLWYAVMRDRDDNDWGDGSFDKAESVKDAMKYRNTGYPDAYIAVIENDCCVEEIREF